MKVWIVRGKFSAKNKNEYIRVQGLDRWDRYYGHIEDGEYRYFTRKSKFSKKELVSIQVNEGAAKRQFNRAKQKASAIFYKFITDVEILEIELNLPNGE